MPGDVLLPDVSDAVKTFPGLHVDDDVLPQRLLAQPEAEVRQLLAASNIAVQFEITTTDLVNAQILQGMVAGGKNDLID